jgi:parallel beta-helix repeat protein
MCLNTHDNKPTEDGGNRTKKAEFCGTGILAIIGLLVSLSFLNSTSLALTTSSTLFRSNGAVQPTPTQYSYIISVSGSNYQILNGATKAVLHQGTSSSQVFNYLLGSSGIATNGNTVYVESGAYSVDATWKIYKSDVKVTFASGAVLTSISFSNVVSPYSGTLGGGQPVLWIYANNVVISGVTIDGNGLNQYPSVGTYITGANFNDGIHVSGDNCLIQYSTVYNCRCFGIMTSYNVAADRVGVMNCLVYDCGANGISASPGTATATNCYFINNEVYGCGDVGIDSYGYDTVITGNNVHDCGASAPMDGYNNAGWGIGLENGGGSGNGRYIFIAGNTVSNTYSGIVVTSSRSGDINNVLISGNTLNSAGWAAIQIWDSSYDIIEFNSISNSQNGIYLDVNGGSSTGNTVFGNTYSGCSNSFLNRGTGTITTQPSIVAVTVTSSPNGVGFVTANGVAGYAGSYSTSPYIFYDTVGNSVTLAANTVSGHSFVSWSDGGAQSHTIAVPSSDRTYAAAYS